MEMELRLHLADSWRGGPVFSRFDIYNMPYRIICVYLTPVSTKTHNTEEAKAPQLSGSWTKRPLTSAPPQVRRAQSRLCLHSRSRASAAYE